MSDGHRVNGVLTKDKEHPAYGDCMNAAEVKNGVDDSDGCPDESLAAVKGDEIVILDAVYFDYGKDSIQSRSFPVLDAVVEILSAYPSIKKIEVQGHTDSRGSDSFNLDLSTRRAASVLRYLTSHGVDAGRVVSKGYGETAPRVPGAVSEEDHAQNRRVQFVIQEKAEDAPKVKEVLENKPEGT